MNSAKNPIVRLKHILQQLDIVADAIISTPNEAVLNLAIERSVQIVSEAAKELPKELRDKYPDVHWRPIIGIGNLLRHEYYRIDTDDMREIATVHFPALKPVIRRMIAEIESSGEN
jgi:uncharacterized protein with HEPN domain